MNLEWRSNIKRAYLIMINKKKESPTCDGTGRVMSEEISFMPQNYDRFAEPVYEEVEIECPDCESFILFIF